MIPKKLFLTKGKGFHKNKLQSFEIALRDAEIHQCNLVKVSSIIPPKCEIIARKEGLKSIKPGMVTYCVLSVCETKSFDEKIAAGIGLAYSDKKNVFGYIAEGMKHGKETTDLSKHVQKIATDMLKTVTNDKVTNDVLHHKNVVQTCKGQKNKWATAVAAAVFLI